MKPVRDIEVISQPSTLRDDIDFKKLLDAVSSILADEYIRIAKENKYIFGIASPRCFALRSKTTGVAMTRLNMEA